MHHTALSFCNEHFPGLPKPLCTAEGWTQAALAGHWNSTMNEHKHFIVTWHMHILVALYQTWALHLAPWIEHASGFHIQKGHMCS
jgi:hypothetical protein